ncbi:UNVERIFIED_CONTAM: hypothetical protein Sangu_2525100 [Sesamum angustifolium]|uniref:Uncharacterized protein n=1 Tax=Sesamum angustifolium TaxID=2727405 RepID=A0AAW2JHN0_9LAMI
MVSFSSTSLFMESKRLSFSDQLLSSPRRKIVSPFGVCIVLFFIFLGAVFSNISSKRPNGDSSFLSWPFCGAFASCSNNSASGGNGVLQTVQRPVNETLKANATGSVQSPDFVGSEGKDKVFEDAQVGNKSEKLQGGSFIVGEGSVVVKTDERNVSSSGRNTISMDGTGEETNRRGILLMI